MTEEKPEFESTGSPPRKKDKKIHKEPGEESVTKMVISLAGMIKKRDVNKLAEYKHRFSRLNSFFINHSVENSLKTAMSSFHDFLNCESYKPENIISTGTILEDESSSFVPKIQRKNQKDDASFAVSSKVTELQSMHDLFGVLTVSKDDMKNKTPSQLVEFVKRVESNQRREAFEKQQRPGYLLKLAKIQSVHRAKHIHDVAQGLHRAVDTINDGDSYVTDSSSGGESADEAEEESFQKLFDLDRLIPM